MNRPETEGDEKFLLFSPSSSYPEPIACLINSRAECVHMWSNSLDQLSPETDPPTYLRGWNHVELADDGSLYATVPRKSLLKLGPDSQLIWRAEVAAHHDLGFDRAGRIHVLSQEPKLVGWGDEEHIILDDTVTVLDPEGRRLAVHSLYELLATEPSLRALIDDEIGRRRYGEGRTEPAPGYRKLDAALLSEVAELGRFDALRYFHELPGWPSDVLHTNTLEVLDAHPQGLWGEGSVLVSVRNLDLIAVLDLEAHSVRWWWGPGELSRQHQPSVLKNGNVLVFDNGYAVGRSRVVETDPVTGSVVWQYAADPPESFYSAVAGGCELLGNDNVLVTDAQGGRAIEVTRSGDTVWEARVERIDSGLAASSAAIYRMSSVPPRVVALANLTAQAESAARTARARGLSLRLGGEDAVPARGVTSEAEGAAEDLTGLHLFTIRPHVSLLAPSEKELRWQYEEIFECGGYEEISLPENAFVVDVGANIGLFALFVKQLRADARIHAFEPMPESARALRANIARSRLSGIEIEELALGSVREKRVDFTYYPVLPGNSTRYPHEKELQKEVLAREEPVDDVERQHAGYTVSVPVERLSTYLKPDQVIDLLKVDVEGAELEVLLGIDAGHWPLVRQVILEVQDLNERLGQICGLLRQHGLTPQVRPSPMIPEDIRTFMVHATR